jgi:putative transposase
MAGAYFVTICTENKNCLLGEVVNGEAALSREGKIVGEEWLKTTEVRPYVSLDLFVVMPNHFHGILFIDKEAEGGTARCAPTIRQFRMMISESLPSIIRGFKSAVTRRINILRYVPGAPVWQRNYYEHVIRDEPSLKRIREYIVNNPLSWELDRENPERKGEDGFYKWMAGFKGRPRKA